LLQPGTDQRHPLADHDEPQLPVSQGGQGVSLVGTWMQQLAMQWLVYRLTLGDTAEARARAAFFLGLVAFCGQIPGFFIAPLAGVLVDRVNRHRTLLVTQTLAMIQAFVLAVLTGSGLIQVWHLILLSVFLGVVNAFDITTRQAFMKEMLEHKGHLANAIALNSSLVNGSRLIGPALAGFAIEWFGETICFVLNGVSYLAVLAALLAMRIPREERTGPPSAILSHLVEGFVYAFGFAPIRVVLLLLGLLGLMGLPYAVLLPIFAEGVLHGGPQTLGYLSTASAVGALGAAVFLASRRTVLGLGRWIAIAAGLFGVALIGFAWSTQMWLSLLLLAGVGFAQMTQMTATNTILQTIVDDDKRGRVMSFYTMAFIGVAPFGSLVAGGLAATSLGASGTITIGGLACIAGALVFAWKLPALREMVRPIYQRLGIIVATPAELQPAGAVLPVEEKEDEPGDSNPAA
jgi:MFS family permease